jgi:hypothetical protein
MSVGTQKSPISLDAGEAIAAHRLVRLHASTAKTVVYADSGERALGVVSTLTASGASARVSLLHGGEVLKVTAAGAISANAEVYPANDGKVSDAVSGEPIGRILVATTTDGDFTLLVPYGMSGGDTDRDWFVFEDDFTKYDLNESGSNGNWTLDSNDGGAATIQDAHGGTIVLDGSDTTVADNDEIYLVTTQEFYKPAIGSVDGEVLAIAKARIKLTEAATDDASYAFLLLGGDTVDVANTIADGGAAPADANQYIGFLKSDGATVFQGVVRDSAQDSDANVGSRTSGSWQELKMVIYDADIADGELEVEFFVDGVSGGTVTYAVASATEMRLLLGVKNGGANEESLHIDKVRLEFKR